jgi:nucleoside-diphosphate-sugar epimerase
MVGWRRWPSMAERRILVTGAAGFIGSAVVRRLAERGDVPVALVRPGGRPGPTSAAVTVEVDVTDAAAVEQAVAEIAPHAIVHAAMAATHPDTDADRDESLRVSVLGTAAVIAAARRSGSCHLVHIGSSLEYGPRDRPIREDDALTPTTPRGAHKAAAAILVGQAAHEGVNTTILRPFSVYGPDERPQRLIPTAIRAAFTDSVLALTPRGIRRDLIYVDDVADAVVTTLDSKEKVFGKVLNLGSGTDLDNHEIVDAVGRVAGRRIQVEVGAHPGRPPDTGRWAADTTAAAALLGWGPTHTLEAGLTESLDWWTARCAVAA